MIDETLLQEVENYINSEESKFLRKLNQSSTLFAHSLRVAKFAQKLALSEKTSSPELAFLGGLFHDVGKFKEGKYHVDGENEEYRSASVASQFLRRYNFEEEQITLIDEAIKDLHQDDHLPSPLSQLIQDADNLDKLAELGIANFFLKSGLRGKGIDEKLFYRVSIELTYAHSAAASMWTTTGKQLAGEKAKITFSFFEQFVNAINNDGLFNLAIEKTIYKGRKIFVVYSPQCSCGGKISREISSQQTLRCEKITLLYQCSDCDHRVEVNFCAPKILKL